MKITNELLAAYAEGNVTPEERKQVRAYLTEHPSQLESVMLMMDDDIEIKAINFGSRSHSVSEIIKHYQLDEGVNGKSRSSFNDNINRLLDDVLSKEYNN